MPKSLFRFFVCFCVMYKAFSLTCYTSNLSSLLSGNLQDLKHKLQECSDYINEVSNTQAPVVEVLHCFTITADYLDVEVKGCLPQDHCHSMVDAFKQMLQTSGAASIDSIGNVDCQECEEDGCNSENEDDLFFFNNTKTKTSSHDLNVVSTANTTHNYGNCLKVKCNRCLLLIAFYYLLCCFMNKLR